MLTSFRGKVVARLYSGSSLTASYLPTFDDITLILVSVVPPALGTQQCQALQVTLLTDQLLVAVPFIDLLLHHGDYQDDGGYCEYRGYGHHHGPPPYL